MICLCCRITLASPHQAGHLHARTHTTCSCVVLQSALSGNTLFDFLKKQIIARPNFKRHLKPAFPSASKSARNGSSDRWKKFQICIVSPRHVLLRSSFLREGNPFIDDEAKPLIHRRRTAVIRVSANPYLPDPPSDPPPKPSGPVARTTQPVLFPLPQLLHCQVTAAVNEGWITPVHVLHRCCPRELENGRLHNLKRRHVSVSVVQLLVQSLPCQHVAEALRVVPAHIWVKSTASIGRDVNQKAEDHTAARVTAVGAHMLG